MTQDDCSDNHIIQLINNIVIIICQPPAINCSAYREVSRTEYDKPIDLSESVL